MRREIHKVAQVSIVHHNTVHAKPSISLEAATDLDSYVGGDREGEQVISPRDESRFLKGSLVESGE